MKIAARGGNGRMAERSPYPMDRGAALQAVAGVHVPQPVGRNGRRQARTLRRGLHDPMDLAGVEGTGYGINVERAYSPVR